MKAQHRVSNRFGRIYLSSRERVISLRDINLGDHITIERAAVYWHHMIVESINFAKNEINVISYSNDSKVFFRTLCRHFSFAVVKRDSLSFTSEIFYRVVYQVDKQQCFSPDEVLRRARRRLGDTNYSLPRNNCEHFATECKTGKPKSLQGWTFWEITGKGALVGLFSNHDQLKMVTEYHWLLEVKKILGLQTSVELKCSDLLQKGWTSFVKLYEKFGIKFLDLKQTLRPIVNTFMQVFLHDCKRGIREMAMPNLKEMELNCGGRSTFYNKFKISKFTLLIAVLTEGTLALNDIDEAFQRKMTNEISSRDYQETVLKRVTSGVSSVPMSVIGSAIGQNFTPGPILGAIIGGMVGNYLGKLAAGNVLSPVLMEVLPWVNLHY